MNESMVKQVTGVVTRHLITAVAGAFGLEAFLTDDIKTAVVAAAVWVAGMAWSYFNKKYLVA